MKNRGLKGEGLSKKEGVKYVPNTQPLRHLPNFQIEQGRKLGSQAEGL